MKLFWKLLISIETIILLIFAVFGCFLMYFSFENSLDREKEQSSEEILFFQYALLTSIGSLPDNYKASDLVVMQIAETIQKNVSSPEDVIKVYNGDKQSIYETYDYESTLIDQDWEKGSCISKVMMQDGEYYIESLLEIDSSIGTYYLEINRNISYIYEEREQLLRSYQMALAIAFLISIILVMLLSVGFTRPIRRLSIETRWFADGNYKRRVTVRGNDEITELMVSFNHMADTIEHTMTELEEDARRQEDFTAAFAHELKTPLTSVIGYADMLRSQKMSAEDRMISADYIFQQGKRLERLSYKLMELVGMKKSEIHQQKIEMPELAEKIKNLTAEILKKKQITLYMQVESGIVYGDMDLLISLFSNLIDNARKACEEEGTIWMMGKKTESGYQIFVQDDGRGIPAEEIHKITEAFYMVDKSRARKEGGAGIGMTLCKRIVELHDAEWKISSEVGKGTRVEIAFPKTLKEAGESFETKKLRKNKMQNIMGVVLILVLFIAALFMPKLYFSYYDRMNEDEVISMDAEMDTYQVQYKSMQEKLYTLGKLGAEKENLQITLLQENSDVETQIELTEKVNEELVAFVEFQPLYENKYCLVTDLTGCKLYTLHTKEETDAVFQGFSFWQLVYTIENSYEIRVLLDAEFEKIYAVGIYDMGEAYYYEMISWLDAITGNYGLENLVYVWAEEILYYYDLREIAYVEYDVITESNAAVYEDLDVYLVNNYEETEEALIDDRMCSLVFYEDETSRLDGGADLKINEETGNVYYEMGFSLMTEYLQL